MHLAQLNIARLRQPMDHPDSADFAAGLDPINALADAAPGFVWRLQTDDGDATALRPHEDPDVIVNLTVWEDAESLNDFVFRTVHSGFLRRRNEWFEPTEGPRVVAWWIEEGHEPTVEEAFDRLAHLSTHGPSEHAFTVTRPFPSPVPPPVSHSGPLSGILVADFSRVLAGPYAAMTLGDLGADVIKVERPGAGDDTRGWGPPWFEGVATYYSSLNRNKRSVTLDLTAESDRALAVELAARADVLVENFRPGTLERFGLGFDQLREANPGLVYCSITGFGAATEEAADLSGYDLMIQAMSGLMSVTGKPDGEPTKVGVALVDHMCALQATVGILAALHARRDSGRGQRVEVSLMATALAALTNQSSAYVVAEVVPRRLGNRHPSIAPYQTFRASDGFFVVACGSDSQFVKLAAIVGHAELATDERFVKNTARVVNIDALEGILEAVFTTGTVEHWVATLNGVGVPAGPINDIGQAFTAAESLGIGPVDDSIGQRSVRSPILLSDTPLTVRRNPPGLGEHDAELRRWLSGN
ncbi:MAG TPA: CoA transferase [Ilumatobacteraceae bacterium]